MEFSLSVDSLLFVMAEALVASVLLVDEDEQNILRLREFLVNRGYRVQSVSTGRRALDLLDESIDVVLADLHMPQLTGVELLERGKPLAPHAVFMLMTERGDISTAVDVIKRGADQYLQKPLDLEALGALLPSAALRAAQHRELLTLRGTVGRKKNKQVVLGDHPLMQQVLKLVEQVARGRASVLIRGETGTGKELVARALHDASGRSGQFVALNCAALAETVLESELFGHERGAFTGALQRRDGRFKMADGGTLFLDEVSEIPKSVQVKLLRFLQEREYERVGSNRTERVDVRVVAAGNVNLERRVSEGLFREDLYYRLNVIDITLPPLRSRVNDIPTLAEYFVRRACVDDGRDLVPSLSPAALTRLLSYPWPGNVRELQNAMERAVAICEGPEISVNELPGSLRDDRLHAEPRLTVVGMTLAELERFAVLKTLEAVHWSPTRAAQLLGVSKRMIQYRLKEWGIERAELGRASSLEQEGTGDTPPS